MAEINAKAASVRFENVSKVYGTQGRGGGQHQP